MRLALWVPLWVPSPPSPRVAGHSVAHLAAEFMARHLKRQRRHPEYVQRILAADVLPRWGSRDARTIKPREVIELLDEIADRAAVMANRVAGGRYPTSTRKPAKGTCFRCPIGRSMSSSSSK
ncbi:MAG TPA: hypothetical protein VNZ53_46605 [Steroidobacteraceae bacterium]|nr:hypothetical protein [Steroidobacteraceae bacterium]